jgi:hypothetical protein
VLSGKGLAEIDEVEPRLRGNLDCQVERLIGHAGGLNPSVGLSVG